MEMIENDLASYNISTLKSLLKSDKVGSINSVVSLLINSKQLFDKKD